MRAPSNNESRPGTPGVRSALVTYAGWRRTDCGHLMHWGIYAGRGIFVRGALERLALPFCGVGEPEGSFELYIHRRLGHTSAHAGSPLGRIAVTWTRRLFVAHIELRPSALVDPTVREDLELWMRTLRHCTHVGDLDLHETWPLNALRTTDPREDLPAVHAYLLDQQATLKSQPDADPARLRYLWVLCNQIHGARFPSKMRAEILRFSNHGLE